MELYTRIVVTLLFVIIVTFILFHIENKSNISSTIVIPILVSLITKYIIGDWDTGFQFTFLDILYWISLLGISYSTVLFLNT
jgi:hypothetical protein